MLQASCTDERCKLTLHCITSVAIGIHRLPYRTAEHLYACNRQHTLFATRESNEKPHEKVAKSSSKKTQWHPLKVLVMALNSPPMRRKKCITILTWAKWFAFFIGKLFTLLVRIAFLVPGRCECVWRVHRAIDVHMLTLCSIGSGPIPTKTPPPSLHPSPHSLTRWLKDCGANAYWRWTSWKTDSA